MKKLFEFRKPENKFVEVEKDEKDPKTGEDIKVKRKEKQIVNRKFFIRRPNRSMWEEGDMFYSVELSRNIKAGLLTKAMLAKRFDDDDGVFSKNEIVRHKEYQKKLMEIIAEREGLEKIDKNEEQKERFSKLENEINAISENLRLYQIAENNLYSNTAEHKARDKTILWWVFYLAYEDIGGAESPIFFNKDHVKGDSFETRLEKYDEIEESEDQFLRKTIEDFIYLITFWFVGSIQDSKDFNNALIEKRKSEQEQEEFEGKSEEKQVPKEASKEPEKQEITSE